jgi:formylglycine-generating enzyme required for sulfatase activity
VIPVLLAGCAAPLDPGEPCESAETCDAFGCWTTICGGGYDMGDARGTGDPDEQPVHAVQIPTLDVMTAELTIGVWNACLADGACAETDRLAADPLCTRVGDDSPLACIDWFQAGAVCAWADARLPTEAEWEFFARSRGLDREYPWGEDPPACDLLVLDLTSCGISGAQPACSTPAGQTDDGLCDVAGNVFEWCEDWYQDSYIGASGGGAAWEVPSDFRVMRGGGIGSIEPPRTRNRVYHDPTFSYPGLGVRCVR